MSKKYKSNKAYHLSNHLDSYALWLMAFVIGIIPLLIRIMPVEFSAAGLTWDTGKTLYYDTYSYVKASAIKIAGSISVILIILKLFYKQIKLSKDIVPIIVVLSMALTITATLNANNVQIAMSGFLERYEGMWVLICYAVIFLLSYWSVWDEGKIDALFKAFWISNVILSLIGLGQAFGADILISDTIRPLITSLKIKDTITLSNAYGNLNFVTQTLYHYNYVGFYIAMSFPIFLSLTLYKTDRRARILYGGTAILILFNLFASTARGGMVGILAGMVVFIIFNRKLLIKNNRVIIVLLVFGVISFGSIEAFTGGLITTRIKQIFSTETITYQLQSIAIDGETIKVLVDGGELDIIITSHEANDWKFDFVFNGKSIKIGGINSESKLFFNQPELHDMYVYYTIYDDDQYNLTVEAEGTVWPFNHIDGLLKFRNPYGNYVSLSEVDSASFLKGRESMGSARGYIWSRAIPLISGHELLGYGPDNFALVFPQEDYVGKLHYYQTTNMVVDKAHNQYLQIALSTGVVSLGCFLLLIFIFVFRLLNRIKSNGFVFTTLYESALAVALVSYFTAAFFNDSSVHVAPVFWVLFGMTLSYLKPNITSSNKSV